MWRNRWSLRYRGLECPAGSSCSSKQWEVVGPLPSFCPCHLEGFLRAADAQSLPWVPLLFLGGGRMPSPSCSPSGLSISGDQQPGEDLGAPQAQGQPWCRSL